LAKKKNSCDSVGNVNGTQRRKMNTGKTTYKCNGTERILQQGKQNDQLQQA
jgi:hypothetical protein